MIALELHSPQPASVVLNSLHERSLPTERRLAPWMFVRLSSTGSGVLGLALNAGVAVLSPDAASSYRGGLADDLFLAGADGFDEDAAGVCGRPRHSQGPRCRRGNVE